MWLVNAHFDKKKVIRFFINLAAIIGGTWLVFKTFQYIAPFVFAALLAFLIEPVVGFLIRKNIPRKIASFVAVIFLLGVLSFVATFIVLRIVSEARDLFEIIPGLFNEVYLKVLEISEGSNNLFAGLPDEVAAILGDVLEGIIASAGEIINDLVRRVLNTAISIPSAVIFLFVMILSTYFISSDRDKITNFIYKQAPQIWINRFDDIKISILNSVVRLLRAYMIIMSITFTELLIGFTIIGVQYGLALAAIIAVVDILPVIGTGGFLVPWSIISFINDDFKTGISLLVLYGIVMIVRQLIEPKIVGSQIGVHPVLTLGAMFVGIKTLGGIGIIMGPIIFLILKSVIQVVFRHQSLKELLLTEDKK
jgi:sporulation integral membrane protein YtvI